MSFYSQPLSYQCGPFALKYALVMLGRMEDEKLIESKAGSTWWAGTDELGLAQAANFFDCTLQEKVTDVYDQAFDFLDKNLENGIPCLLCVDSWAHWITVVTKEQGRYVCIDSALDKVITIHSRTKLNKRWKYVNEKDEYQYSGYALRPNFRSHTHASISIDIAKKLMSDKYSDLSIKWDKYFNLLIEIGRMKNPIAEYTISFAEFLRRNQKMIVEQVADWHGDIEYDELNEVFENFRFIAGVYDIVIHLNDEKKAIIDFTTLLTMHSTFIFGTYEIF